jgi:hypothetical protein
VGPAAVAWPLIQLADGRFLRPSAGASLASESEVRSVKKPVRKPAKRNLAAKALRSPLFRPEAEPNPKAYKRKKRVELPAAEDEDQIN